MSKEYDSLKKTYNEMESLLRAILEDGTQRIPTKKRVWSIRATHYRQGAKLLRDLEKIKGTIRNDT